MKTLIIGASGFIGRYLADHLAENRHTVVVSSRNTDRARKLLGKRFEYISWDGLNPAQLSPHLEQVDAVVNLAGENIGARRWTESFKKRYAESRVRTGKALAEAILAASKKPDVLIQGSAVGIYGTDAGTPDGERRKPGEGYLAQLVIDWEASVASLEQESKTRVVYIRTGQVLGKNEGLLKHLNRPYNFGMGVILGTGNQMLSWIHIHDQAAAIRFLIENPATRGPFNMTAPEPVSMRQMMKAIGKLRRRPVWLYIPSPALRLIFGEMAEETILASQDILPEALLDAGYAFRFTDLEDALENLYR